MRILFEVVKYHEQGFIVDVGEKYTIEMQGRGDLNFKLIVDLEFEKIQLAVQIHFHPLSFVLGCANYEKFRFDALNSFLNLLRKV